ncbi:MAG TPA: hypothetical protein VFM14_01750 [Gemmatimonadales bacterium]|nr:hypothetical protein [Gemmatimonadales bacterium]
MTEGAGKVDVLEPEYPGWAERATGTGDEIPPVGKVRNDEPPADDVEVGRFGERGDISHLKPDVLEAEGLAFPLCDAELDRVPAGSPRIPRNGRAGDH